MLEGTDVEHNVNASILGREVHYNKVNSRFAGNVRVYEIPLDFFETFFYSFYNNSILLYCKNFYGRGFI